MKIEHKIMPLIFTFLTLFSITSFAGPIIVGGAGESEYSMVHARTNFKDLIDDCLNISCSLSSEQKIVLHKLINFSNTLPLLVFKTSADMNTLYKIQTDLKSVWINRDMLWSDKEKSISINIGEALQIWIHILDEINNLGPELKSVADLVVNSTKNKILRGNIQINDEQTFEYILWNRPNRLHFVIRDPTLNTIQVSSLFDADSLNCSTEPHHIQIFSPALFPLVETNFSKSLTINLHFGISWVCNSASFSTNGVFFVTAEKMMPEKVWSFNLSTVGLIIN
jgi:hypothetical protein